MVRSRALDATKMTQDLVSGQGSLEGGSCVDLTADGCGLAGDPTAQIGRPAGMGSLAGREMEIGMSDVVTYFVLFRRSSVLVGSLERVACSLEHPGLPEREELCSPPCIPEEGS